MYRIMLFLVVAVQLAINFECIQSAHHSKFSRGWRNFVCRIKHRKIILDFKGKSIGCSDTCPEDHDEKYTFRWGHHCKQVVLPDGCADRFCIRCIPGYKWFYTFPTSSRCIKECPSGYADKNAKICIQCAKGCLECEHADNCTKCQETHAMFDISHGKTICIEKCPSEYKEIKMQGIAKCVMNSVATVRAIPEASEELGGTTKEMLPEGCIDKSCINCIKGYSKYSLSNGRGNQCLQHCPLGYKVSNSVCIACSDRRCASCSTSIGKCEKCFSGYVMQMDALNNAVECLRTCPRRYTRKVVNNVTVCILKLEPECPVANCKQCIRSNLHVLHFGCEECVDGFKLFRGTFKDHCFTACPEGYFTAVKPRTNITTCEKCQVPFCSRCINKKTCKECIGPMVLDSSARCTTCPPKQNYNFENRDCIPDDAVQGSIEKNEIPFELISDSNR